MTKSMELKHKYIMENLSNAQWILRKVNSAMDDKNRTPHFLKKQAS